MKRVILMPVFNDWEAVSLLVLRLDSVLREHGLSAQVLLVDDGSYLTGPVLPVGSGLDSISEIRVLRLRRNLGHQRAIAVGLSFLEATSDSQEILVMDSDGEDRPEDVPRLIEALAKDNSQRLIFAERRRRSEGLGFRMGYRLFRQLYRVLTGHRLRFGNFSVIPMDLLRRLVSVSEVWNHYAAAVIAARIPYTSVPTDRGKRLDGRSHMSFQALVMHGLSAMSVFTERVGLRLMLAAGAFALVILAPLVAVVLIRLFTDLAIPGWASTVGGILLVLMVQAFTLMGMLVFVTLHSRSSMEVIPKRDYSNFILEVRAIYPPSADVPG